MHEGALNVGYNRAYDTLVKLEYGNRFWYEGTRNIHRTTCGKGGRDRMQGDDNGNDR